MSANSQNIALVGARIFTGKEMLPGKALLLKGTRIAGICDNGDIPDKFKRRRLAGGTLAPGFIDLQVNGGGGVFFNDEPTVDGICTIAKAHRAYGTTSMLPTLISDNFDKMRLACRAVEEARANGLAGILGIHIEGPYLNLARKGVHDPAVIREVDAELFELLSTEKLGPSILTVAPETLGTGVLRKLAATGFQICAGHTAATHGDIQKALAEGLTGFTHLFNAMTPMDSREPGVVGAALEDDESYCGIIVDGYHIHPVSMKVAVRAKKKGRMMLVSDAMPSVGAANKAFKIRDEDIIVENGKCITRDGTLAGSDLDMMGAVRNTVEMLGLPLEEALRMASLYPATYMGVDNQLGRLDADYQADIVHFSKEYQVLDTWIKGQCDG